MADKSRLRRKLREKRRNLPAFRQKLASQALTRRALAIIPGIDTASRIAFFIAADGETDLMPLIRKLRTRGASCYLPVLDDNYENRLEFALYTPGEKMTLNRFGIPEPHALGRQRHNYRKMDIIFMPTVGFDDQGRRLGMGGGFYDRTLSTIRLTHRRTPLLVAVAHDIQYTPQLPDEPWDIHPDITLTPARIIRRNS